MAGNSWRFRWLLLPTVVGLCAVAHAESAQERKRDNLLNELGLKKEPPAPVPAPPSAPSGAPATEKQPAGNTEQRGQSGGHPAALGGPSFTREIHPLVLAICRPCHTAGGAAGATPLLLTGDIEADHRALARFVDVPAPKSSKLLEKASGAAPHGGGALWPVGGGPYEKVLAWIRAGARLDHSAHEASVASAASEPVPGEPEGRREDGHRELRPSEITPSPAVPALAPGTALAVPAAAGSAPARSGAATFATAVHPVLMSVCAVCHRPGGAAGKTRFLLSGEVAKDEEVVRTLVDPRAPDSSLLLTKAAGQAHAGGALLPLGDPRRAAIAAWIAGLAPAATAAGPPANSAGPETAAAPAVPIAEPSPRGPSPSTPVGGALPLGFLLNGRFDVNYERRQFNGNPFGSGSVAGLRSYHHFLFLSRDAGDPCGLTVEMLTLLFWEGHCRLPWRPKSVSMSVSAGKIVVPFGADPLFHQSYGGLAGFDQVVLPPVWSIEGAAAHAVYWHGPLAIADDLYIVRGYALQQADAVINLQNDFSADDATKLAIGDRIGAAWMAVSAWYSAYFNPLGFGRRLFMQAIDVNIWRQRQIPVLGHFSLGFGVLRADVSGGGPGIGGVGYDYYDFADYLQLRYYPVDWLFLQYRTGFFSFDNMRGLVLDNSRLTNADGSTHNFGIVARTRNLWFGIFYFVNLEKVNEIRNDLLRLNVTYEF